MKKGLLFAAFAFAALAPLRAADAFLAPLWPWPAPAPGFQ